MTLYGFTRLYNLSAPVPVVMVLSNMICLPFPGTMISNRFAQPPTISIQDLLTLSFGLSLVTQKYPIRFHSYRQF